MEHLQKHFVEAIFTEFLNGDALKQSKYSNAGLFEAF